MRLRLIKALETAAGYIQNYHTTQCNKCAMAQLRHWFLDCKNSLWDNKSKSSDKVALFPFKERVPRLISLLPSKLK